MTSSRDQKRRNHLASGQGGYGQRAGAKVGQKRNHLEGVQPPCNHLENGEFPETNQACNHRNHLIDIRTSRRGVKDRNRGVGKEKGEEVVTVVAGGFVHLSVNGAVAARKDQRARLVACNESGERVGEYHHNARITDAQVEAIRDRYEAGQTGAGPKIGYRKLAREFGISHSTVRDIVTYRRRNAWPARWKRVTSG